MSESFDKQEVKAANIIEAVPPLAWGKGKDCTFIGALDAALSITDAPFKYSDMMGYSGLAFRVRWFCGKEGAAWCPSCAVGEMDEEIGAIKTTTGWPLLVDFNRPEDQAVTERISRQIIASIDRNKPVLAYSPQLDMGVIYGYEDAGKTLLMRDYSKGDELYSLAVSELGFLILFIDERKDALSAKKSVIFAFMSAVRNWKREHATAGPGEYWYGKAALEHWIDDIRKVEEFPPEQQEQLRHVSWFNFLTMLDARKAAVVFLEENANLLENKKAEAEVKIAVEIYRKELELLQVATAKGMFAKTDDNWVKGALELELPVMSQLPQVENVVIMQLDKALQLLEI